MRHSHFITSDTYLVTQYQLVTGLFIVVCLCFILLILGIRKHYLLKKENRRLNELHKPHNEDAISTYKKQLKQIEK